MEIVKNIDPGHPRSPRSLTTIETFHYLQIFCVLSDNSTYLNCHFEIVEWYQAVFSLFPFFYYFI